MRAVLEFLLKVLGFFVILEPVWMLLPFAGFLYGSVLQIENLNQHPQAAWLTHFVFPILTGGWLGPVLVVVGFVLFCIGAGQIYYAKWRRAGVVTNGLYRFVRHPQYIALTFLGLGILLTWGRALMFLAFFLMMFLYYYLAKSEERICLRLFGAEYERYRERTSFIIPGDRALRRLRGKLPTLGLPALVRVPAAFVATLAVCFGLIWLIDAIKVRVRQVPFLTATIQLPSITVVGPTMTAGATGGVPFVRSDRVLVARGPYRNAAVPGFAEAILRRLGQSAALKDFVGAIQGREVLFVFCAPIEKTAGAGVRGPAPDSHGPDRVRLIMMRCSLADGATMSDALADTTKRKILRGCIAPVNLARAENEDFVEDKITLPGPGFPGEERWAFLFQQFAAQQTPPLAAAVASAAETATLVVVQAPILRTRLDPDLAAQLRDRLATSPVFLDRLRKVGAGGQTMAVAFPRPGPNWYREHHRQPQVSVFVTLAQLRTGAKRADLFAPGQRDLMGAFIAETDFRREPPADFVGEIITIGLKRDLEERWRFFLSGVGGGDLHMH
jgi:protein-S-isoprenylcysteine O-methyltransferase Ste14